MKAWRKPTAALLAFSLLLGVWAPSSHAALARATQVRGAPAPVTAVVAPVSRDLAFRGVATLSLPLTPTPSFAGMTAPNAAPDAVFTPNAAPAAAATELSLPASALAAAPAEGVDVAGAREPQRAERRSSAGFAMDAERHAAGGSTDVEFDGRRRGESRASIPVTTFLFPVSTVVHELGHYVAARMMGFTAKLHIDRVTLDRGQKLTPRQSMVLSMGGPAANLVFAGALWLLAGSGVVPQGLPGLLVDLAIGVNVGMAVFNLIPMALPGFPLKTDGWQFGAAFLKWLRVRSAPVEDVSRSALHKRDRRGAIAPAAPRDAERRLAGVAGSPEDAALVARAVQETLALEERYAAMPARRLAASTARLRQRLRAGEDLDALLPDAFAAARETMARVLGKRPYVEQVAAAAAIHHGRVVEQRTGEGKTLSIGLAAYLNALAGPVDVLTFNPYLAQRDAGEIGEVLEYLGMKIGFLGRDEEAFLFDSDRNIERGSGDVRLASLARSRVYREADVLYGDNAAFVFDYLRDQDAGASGLQLAAGRRRAFAIVDEADANLLEEAQTDYRIVVQDESAPLPYEYLYALTARWTRGEDFILPRGGEVRLTERGRARVENLRSLDKSFERWPYLDAYVVNALKARHALEIDRDYAVVSGRAVILDPHTGYLLHGRNWEEGLHRFVEVKERLWGAPDYRLASHVALNNFMRLYEKKSGITGTLGASDAEFSQVYGLSAVRIPPHRPSARQDLPDRFYRTEAAALAAAVEDAVAAGAQGRPVLLGVRDLAESVRVAALLRQRGAAFELLNGVQAKSEEQIIKEAGRPGRITVATQLAGRGTDIKLSDEALARGGLHVVLTTRSSSLRVDLQYRGRAGRQGQPGSSRVFLSAEDPLFADHAEPGERERLDALAARGDGAELSGAAAALVASVQNRAEADAAAGRSVSRLKDAALQPLRERYFRARRELRERRVVGRSLLMDRLHADWVTFIAEYEDLWRRRDSMKAGVAARAESRYEELVARPHRRLRDRWLPWRAAWSAATVVPRYLNGWMFALFLAPVLRVLWSFTAWVLAGVLSVPGTFLRLVRLGALARPLHEVVVALTPKDASARLRLGRVLAAQGRHREAVDRFIEALQPAAPRRPSAPLPRYLRRVVDAFQRWLPVRAGTKVVQAARQRSRLKTDAEAVHALAATFERSGLAAQREGRWLRAAADYRIAMELEPNAKRGQAMEAAEGRLNAGEKSLAATAIPEMKYAYLHAARSAVDANDFPRADYLFGRVVDADPSVAAAHYGRGFVRVKLGRPDSEDHLMRGLYYSILESRQFYFMRESYAKAMSRSLSMADFDHAFTPGARKGFSNGIPGRNAAESGWIGQQNFERGNYVSAYRAFTVSLRQAMFDASGRSPMIRIGHHAKFSWMASSGREAELFIALENLIQP